MQPSRLIAAFSMTNGRRSRISVKNGWFSRVAASTPRPTSTAMPCDAKEGEAPAADERVRDPSSPRRRARSRLRRSDRRTGPVRPMWQHGSSVQYSVAPRVRPPASSARAPPRAARRRARGSPGRRPRRRATRPPRRPSGSDWCARARAPRETARGPCSRRRSRHHFSSNSPSTYSSAENGTRSSMPSPTPT